MNKQIFKLSNPPGAPVSDSELIDDLRRVAQELDTRKLTGEQYEANGAYHRITQQRRFGSWNKALQRAGLEVTLRQNHSDEELFENMLTLWQHLGRQPHCDETLLSPSTVSFTPYKRRFGSWMKALRAFVDYANGTGSELAEHQQVEIVVGSLHKTPRDPSLRLRWRVLQRDNFKCCACGASPAITLGVELHVDHIHPWSGGGETIFENLQTLCSNCNLGKSNLLPT
jgi:Homing endonuclease associated repeat/HNH endonuclease